MRKGINRIALGALLIIFTIISLIGNSLDEDIYRFDSLANLLAFSIGFLSPCLFGIMFVVSGITAYNTGKRTTLILHRSRTKVLNFVFVFLLMLMLIAGIISKEPLINSVLDILYIYAALTMLLYLWFHQGKRSSSFFAASLFALGYAFVFSPLLNLYNILSWLIATENSVYHMMMCAGLMFTIACGSLNIAIGALVSQETFSVPLVRFLGFASFLLFIIPEIENIFSGSIYIDFRLPLQSAILIYTCFVPFRTNN